MAAQATPAQQKADTRTWYQAYADAQRSAQQGDWTAVIADIEAARRLGAPQPGRSVLFTGDVYRAFNPDYYLGVAYLSLGRFEEADGAFEQVRQAKLIVANDALYKEFDAQASTARLAVEKEIAARQLASKAPTPGPPPVPPGPTIDPVPETVAPPVSASPADAVAASAADTVADASSSPAIQKPPVQPPLTVNPPPRAADIPAIAATPPAGRFVPPAGEDERSAMVRFFQGDYQSAVAYLGNIASLGSPTPRTYFYLACGRAALVLVGLAPRSELDGARAQLALAGDTGQFNADKALISPRVRQVLGIE
jgi:tetratricopeptide (TPR) repeat protein